MSKKANIIQVLIFVGFMGVVCFLNLITPPKDFSEVENRYLAQLPQFTVDELVNGSFTADFEKYTNDQFILRDSWITLKAATELASGKGENNNIFYCENGTLIERFVAPDDQKLETNSGYINEFAQKVDVPVYFGIVPSAAEIWSYMMPHNTPNDSQKDLIDKVYSTSKATTVDLYSALEQHKDEYIFYRTDHHWTTKGAYYGYSAVMDAMGLEANPEDHYDIQTVADDFLGTIYSSSGFTWTEADYIQTYVQPYEGLKIANYSSGMPEAGSLYDMSYLDKKDKYSMFFGGISPLVEIDTGNEGLPSLLIIRDSYMDSLSPFLLEHFSEIDILDLRYNNTSVSQYIEEHDIDSVLICYSTSNFAADTNLYKLAK